MIKEVDDVPLARPNFACQLRRLSMSKEDKEKQRQGWIDLLKNHLDVGASYPLKIEEDKRYDRPSSASAPHSDRACNAGSGRMRGRRDGRLSLTMDHVHCTAQAPDVDVLGQVHPAEMPLPRRLPGCPRGAE
jgi:hypothetical protein